MKKVKKIICLLLAMGMLAIPATFAEESVSIVGIDDIITDKEAWVDSANKVKFENNSVVREKDNEYFVYTYTGKKYQNELLEFDVNFGDFHENAWSSIMLKTNQTDKKNMWDMAQHYAFNIRPEYIELQKRNGASTQIGMYPCDIKPNETVTIQCGAINMDDGVQVIFKINGKTIVNYYDTESPVTAEGWFALYNNSKLTLSASKNKEFALADAIPVKLKLSEYKAGSDKLTASYEKLGGDDEMHLKWYEADSSMRDVIAKTTPDQYNLKDVLKEIPDMTDKEEYAISEKDLEKYILTGVETKDGYITLSNEVYVDPYTYKISKGTFLLNEYEKAYSNTEYKYIDKDNDMFTPETIDDTVYVPARFLNEELGGETAWNDTERYAQFTLFGKTIKIYADSASAVVDGTDITLKNAPVISYSRLMLGFDDIETVFGIKTKMYDNDLMSFSKEALELTDGEAEKTAASIQVAIIK